MCNNRTLWLSFSGYDGMVVGVIIFVVVSAAVIVIGGRFWKGRPLPRKRAVLYAAIFILMSTGLLIMIVGAVQIRYDLEIRSWPTVAGKIVSSHVSGVRAFHPAVTYTYTVDGVRHTATSALKMPGFGGRRNRLETSEILVEEYPPGAEIVVHYDPENPARSALNAGLSYGACLQIAFGFLLYLSGVFMLPWRFRLRSRPILK